LLIEQKTSVKDEKRKLNAKILNLS